MVDNTLGSGNKVRLVLWGGGTIVLANTANSYTGGTVVNSGTVSITPASAGVVVPAGGLTINNSTVNFGSTTLFGLIASTNVITINGSGTLTFPNYTAAATNTLDSVVFNDDGGNGTPTLNLGTPTTGNSHTFILSNANAISVTNDNYANTPTISGGALASLQFSAASPVINVTGQSPMGLIISAIITQNAGMTDALHKTGAGSLVLNAASTWTTGFNLDGGTLIIDANSTPSTVGATVTSGPLGTGTLTIADGTTLQAGTSGRTIANSVIVNGNFAFGGTTTSHNLTLNGTMDLGGGNRVITVTSPQVTATVGGVISNGGITKSGNGILVLSNAGNTYGGPTVVNGGLLKLGASGAIPAASALSVLCGGTLDLAGVNLIVASLASESSVLGGLITSSTTSGTATLTFGDSGNTSFGGAITNNVGSTLNIVKQGSGVMTMGGPNSYSGSTTITDGSIVNAANNVLPDTTNVTLAPSAASGTALWDLNGFNDAVGGITFAGNTSSTSTIQTGTGTLTLFGNVAYDATNNPSGATISGKLNLGGATRTFNVGHSTNAVKDLTVSATVSGTNPTDGVTKTGTGTLVFSSSGNDYAGATTISGGTLEVTKLANGGVNSSIGSSSNAASNLIIAGGTLAYTGSGDSTDRQFSVGDGGATIDSSGTGALNFTSTAAVTHVGTADSARTIALTGSNTDANTLAAPVADNGLGTVSFTKSGAGNWVLSGDSTFTGATNVTDGNLQVGVGGTGSIGSGAAMNVTGTGGVSGTASGVDYQNVPVTGQNIVSGPAVSGTGTINRDVVLGSVSTVGVIKPGDSAGTGNGVITLYKEKEVVKRNVPSAQAVDELIELIRAHGDWVEAEEQ